jgi:hypothetical protein
MLQIFETRNALDAFASQQAPQDNHQPAVSNHQISRQHGAPIHLVFAQSRETGPGRSDEKSSALKHRRYRFIHVASEETDAKNLHTGSHQRTPSIQHRTPNFESKGAVRRTCERGLLLERQPTTTKPPETFPVRFGHKFGKLSAGAKPYDRTQIR